MKSYILLITIFVFANAAQAVDFRALALCAGSQIPAVPGEAVGRYVDSETGDALEIDGVGLKSLDGPIYVGAIAMNDNILQGWHYCVAETFSEPPTRKNTSFTLLTTLTAVLDQPKILESSKFEKQPPLYIEFRYNRDTQKTEVKSYDGTSDTNFWIERDNSNKLIAPSHWNYEWKQIFRVNK